MKAYLPTTIGSVVELETGLRYALAIAGRWINLVTGSVVCHESMGYALQNGWVTILFDANNEGE